MNSLDNMFSVACDSYGLNTKQIDNLIESSNVITDSINGWNDNKKDLYIQSYQVLTHVLGSGQKNGVFSLEIASKLFKALVVIKNYILNRTISDGLEKDNQFIRMAIQNKVLAKCIYNQTDLKRINLALESLECVFDNKDKDKAIDNYQAIDVNRGYNTVLAVINKAQSKGKFTLQQANSIMQLLTTLKQNVLKYNEKQSKAKVASAFPDPLPELELETTEHVSLIKEKTKPVIQKKKMVTIKKNDN